jgi:hypothetical protein
MFKKGYFYYTYEKIEVLAFGGLPGAGFFFVGATPGLSFFPSHRYGRAFQQSYHGYL